jgi:glycosyltransferase involved in cell wall biosynthesis
MKILIVSQYFYPEQFLINEIAENLVHRGNQVTVLTGLPNYPHGRIPFKYRFFRNRTEFYNGVKIVRVSMVSRGNTLKMFFNAISYAIFASIKSLFMRKYDVIYSYQMTPITQVIPAIIYKKIKKTRLCIYVCDVAPSSGEKRFNKYNILRKIYKFISRKIYEQGNILLVSSEQFSDYLVKTHGIIAEKIHYLPQHGSNYMLNLNLNKERKNIISFLFAGNVGFAQNLPILLKVTKAILAKKISNFKFDIVGDGSKLEELKLKVNQENLNEYFEFHVFHKNDEMIIFYRNADALIITLRKSDGVGMTIPSKFQTYLTVGKPIFGSLDGQTKELINQNNLGYCSDADDHENLADILCKYIINPHEFENMGKNALDFYKKYFTIETHIDNLILQLESLT